MKKTALPQRIQGNKKWKEVFLERGGRVFLDTESAAILSELLGLWINKGRITFKRIYQNTLLSKPSFILFLEGGIVTTHLPFVQGNSSNAGEKIKNQ